MKATKMREARMIQRFLISMRDQYGNNLSAQQLNVLLEVYLNGEIAQSEVIKRADLTRSAASKNIAGWTRLTAYKTKGPGLIESRIDPMNMKVRVLHIVDAGIKAVEAAIEGGK